MAWMIPFMSRPPQDALPDMKESRSVTRQHSDLRPRLLLGGGNLLPRTARLNGLRVMGRCVYAASRSSHCGDVMMPGLCLRLRKSANDFDLNLYRYDHADLGVDLLVTVA
jgi:hypothetical protein